MEYSNNQLIVDKFQQLIEIRDKELQDYKTHHIDKKIVSPLLFKVRNYKLGLAFINNFPTIIQDSAQLKGNKGIGDGILKRVQEILDTNTLEEVDKYDPSKHLQLITNSIESEPNDTKFVRELQQINGIGPVKAKKLVEENITLDKLLEQWESIKDDPDKIKTHSIIGGFTNSQKLGIQYYKDIQSRIPRNQIDEIKILLDNVISKDINWEICGSYRRGKPDSGDIDILISRKDLETKEDLINSGILKKIVDDLTQKNILIANLTKMGDTKYMGICKIPNYPQGRRIDIRCVAYPSYIPGLLYFTGSMEENVRLRNIAIRNKFKINEYGFYKLLPNNVEELIILDKEEDLYYNLQQEYKPPTSR